MVLLGDEARMEARFGPFGDSANVDARQVHGLQQI
jgi:putative transposon-encoded protein